MSLAELRGIAAPIVRSFGFKVVGRTYRRQIGEHATLLDVIRSAISQECYLNVGVFFDTDVTLIPNTVGAEGAQIHMRPVDFEPKVANLKSALDLSLSLDTDRRSGLLANGFREAVIPAIVKLTDLDFLRSEAGRIYTRRMPVSLSARRSIDKQS